MRLSSLHRCGACGAGFAAAFDKTELVGSLRRLWGWLAAEPFFTSHSLEMIVAVVWLQDCVCLCAWLEGPVALSLEFAGDLYSGDLSRHVGAGRAGVCFHLGVFDSLR